MYISSPACQKQTADCSKFRIVKSNRCTSFPPEKVSSITERKAHDFDKTFFNTTNFHRFQVHPSKLLTSIE